jgi:hypothetical protein
MPRGSGDVGFVHMGDGHDDQRQALDDEGYTYTGGGGDDPAAPQRRVEKTVVAPVPHTLPPKVTAIPPLPTRPTTFSPATDAGRVTKGPGVVDTRRVTAPPAGFSRHPKYGYFVQPEEDGWVGNSGQKNRVPLFGSSIPSGSIDSASYDTYFNDDGSIEKVVAGGTGRAYLNTRGETGNLQVVLLKLTNNELLDRANSVYAEGGGAFADTYANAIENAKLAGSTGYGPKPFKTEKEI